MHPYNKQPKELEREFNEFVGGGGQFQMKTREWVFRGEIKECIVLSDRRLKISFNWLCERHFFFDVSGTPQPKWSLLTPPPGLHHLDVEFRYFYPQPDEDRIKVKGRLGEICHFFRKEDHTNLVRCGEEFTPYCQLHKLKLRQVAIALYLKNQK